jgi:O-methyltransferase
VLKSIFRRPAKHSAQAVAGSAMKPPATRERKSEPGPQPPVFNPKVRWWSDAAFLARYGRHVQPDALEGRYHPHRILDRRFTLAQFAGSVRHLRGSTAECGVFKGIGSALVCEALRDTYRDGERHFGFDSFEGLPEPGPNDANWQRGDLAQPIDVARRHLDEFPMIQLIAGWLPETLMAATDCVFRLVHIDVDIERTTRECLDFFYPRMTAGGLFLFDDYGFHSCPGARRAVDEFLRDKPETLIELTTGQAVFYRSPAVALH